MKTRFLLVFLLFILVGCYHHDEINYIVVCPYKSGIYNGTFKILGGCYACIPYTDTTYQGDLEVKINANDTISLQIQGYEPLLIKCRLPSTQQGGEWFKSNDIYIKPGLGTGSVMTVQFIEPDSLTFISNQYGGGGYYEFSFEGKRR